MANGLSGNCVKCGTWRRSLHRDHIVPKFKGGPDEPSNIQLLCANCHEDKTVEDLTGWPMSGLARAAQSKAQLGKPCSDQRRKAISEAHRRKIENDPDYAEKVRWLLTKPAIRNIRWRCDECGMVSTPGAIGTHQSSKGHSGRSEVSQ